MGNPDQKQGVECFNAGVGERNDMPHLFLEDVFVDEVLEFLQCRRQTPGLDHLNTLIRAFIQKVPWESVFRIIKRNIVVETSQCPRWPGEFWNDAMNFNGGGTCFEINYAFYSLLKTLGYEGYMTVNDMEEAQDCHAAIVVVLDTQKYLVDVSIPLPRSFSFSPNATTFLYTNWLNFTIEPLGENRYTVSRSPHARSYIFTLDDTPVDLHDYEDILENDYGSQGYFLDRVVINKMIGEIAWLFNSNTTPYKLEAFNHSGKHEIPINPENTAEFLADWYQLPQDKISTALSLVEEMKKTHPPQTLATPAVLEDRNE